MILYKKKAKIEKVIESKVVLKKVTRARNRNIIAELIFIGRQSLHYVDLGGIGLLVEI